MMEDSGTARGAADLTGSLQLRNILCPVDFSEFSSRTFAYAVCLARHFGSHLFVQHTVEPAQYVFLEGIGPGVVKPSPDKQLRRSGEAIRQMLIAQDVDSSEATVLLNQGDVSTRILETIARESIDLVVMGTHGRRGFNRLLVGSVTEGIIHRATCPVLAVNQPEAGAGLEKIDKPTTILLATDFSTHSNRAAVYAMKWASEWHSRVVVLHTVQEASVARRLVDLFPEYNPRFEQQLTNAWARIDDVIPNRISDCETTFEVRTGNPKEEILRVAGEYKADLIITGARGAAGSLPWGSVSSAVIRNGRIPVLVVREL